MQKILLLLLFFALYSCKQTESEERYLVIPGSEELKYRLGKGCLDPCKSDTIINTEKYWNKIIAENKHTLKNKNVVFFWNEIKYSHNFKRYTIFNHINKEYCKTISEPERAALAYISLYAVSLSYDPDNPREAENIQSAINLDYECSEKFISFYKSWFRHEKKALEKVNPCYQVPDTSSEIWGFKKITLSVKGNKIYINAIIQGNFRDEHEYWWYQNYIFLVKANSIKLISEKGTTPTHTYNAATILASKIPAGYIDDGNGNYYLPQKSKKK